MKLEDFAKTLLNSPNINDKLFDPKEEIEICISRDICEIPQLPARSKKIPISDIQAKFPKKGTLNIIENRGRALHFFANHELLAIEIMAAVLLKLPTSTPDIKELKRQIVFTIRDEQKHLSLYIKRMNELGAEFGDFPLNDFFWRQVFNMNSFSDYLSIMSLTFEAANLDFAGFYEKLFSSYDDNKSSIIMNTVYQDELKHVQLGVEWLNKWKESKTLWQYYIDHLPGVLTPARSKGIHYSQISREKAGFDKNFISNINNYKDEFKITNRKI